MRNLFRKIWDLAEKKLSKDSNKSEHLKDFLVPSSETSSDNESIEPKVLGFCNENQYVEIYSRLIRIRGKTYEKEQENDKHIGSIDVLMPIAAIEELCRKLPMTREEINREYGILSRDIFDNYLDLLLKEINDFIKKEGITKGSHMIEIDEGKNVDKSKNSKYKVLQNENEIAEIELGILEKK